MASATQASHYVIALVATAAAVSLRAALQPWLGDDSPFTTVYGAVALAVWVGGTRPGVLAMVVGYVACNLLYVSHFGASPARTTQAVVGLLAYLASCAAIIGLGSAARSSKERAECEASERRRAEQKTSELLAEQTAQRELLTALLDNTSLCVAAMKGPELRFTFVNRALQELLPDSPMLGRTYEEIFPDAFASGGGALLRRVMDTGEARADSNRRVSIPGTPDAAWDNRVVRLPVREGEAPSILLLAWNVTQRERAMQAVEASRVNFTRLADAMPQLVWTACADGVVDYYSARRLDYHGASYEPHEWQVMVHPGDMKATLEAWSTASASGQPYEIEHRIRMADGTCRWHLSRALPALDSEGRVTKWFGTATDIDGLKRAEGDLAATTDSVQRERARLAVALRAGNMGVYEWVVGSPTVWWSRELYEVFGVDPADFVPTPDSVIALIHPDDRAEHWRRLEDCLAQGVLFRHEFRILRPDGEQRWVRNQAQLGLGPNGDVEQLTGVAIDVTERKRAEELLVDADRRKDQFIATLAHELRNPLAPIRNAVKLLGADPAGSAHQAWARDVIERQVTHMARLLDDLLDISRISRDRVELQVGHVTLASVIDMAIETSQPAIERGRHELTVSMPAEPVWLETDAVRLAQVLSNLLNNSAKYTEPGGHIRLTMARRGTELEVVVADDGIGIAHDMQAFVFNMFSQAKPAIERSQGGLGIGLSLAKGLVEAMGGRIEVRSDGVGRGSEFKVRLPLPSSVEAAGSDTLPLEFAAAAAVARVRIVVADDLQDSADSLALLLQAHGYEVSTAYDGEEAVVLCSRLRPDVVLLDIGMPKLNGYEACDRIRSDPHGRSTYIIALTGWGEEDSRRRTQATGFDLHMVKPVDIDALLDVLASRRPRAVDQPSRCSLRGQAEASTVAR